MHALEIALTNWPAPEHTPALLVAICLAALGTVALFCIGLVACFRRPTRRYLLVSLALAILVFQTIIGLGTVLGYVPMTVHHFIQHGLDFLIATLILVAVYLSGSKSSTPIRLDAD
jgi:cell division protein FtsW (lipid II flippase)